MPDDDRKYVVGLLESMPDGLRGDPAAAAAWLYSDGYVVRHVVPYPAAAAAAGPSDDTSILAELVTANGSRKGFEPGWRIEFASDDGPVIATNGLARRRFDAGEFVNLSGPVHRLQAGGDIAIHAPAGFAQSTEAFCFAFGETVDPFGPSSEYVRIYWNVSAEGAAPLIAAITREFNRFQIPFRFKCVHRAAEFYRLDAAVLYVHRYWWSIVAKLIRRVHDQTFAWLGDAVPMLTKRLAPGLSLAEDPPGGESFGQHRCEIIAKAAWNGTHPPDLIERNLNVHFANAGLDFSRPYLNARSEDRYEFC